MWNVLKKKHENFVLALKTYKELNGDLLIPYNSQFLKFQMNGQKKFGA